MECFGIELRDLQRGLALFASLGQYFILAAILHLLAHMTDIGDIFDVHYLKATILEVAAYPVGHSKCTQVADMNEAVDGRAARIHLDLARLYGNNLFNSSSQSIIDSHNAAYFDDLAELRLLIQNRYSILWYELILRLVKKYVAQKRLVQLTGFLTHSNILILKTPVAIIQGGTHANRN